jgi:glycosyltransferase involved in cell wall biosynthesis
MRVLFVSSGNSKEFGIVPFIKEQGESLRRLGVDIDYYPIHGNGLMGYLKAGIKLRKYLKQSHYDLIHAHFVLSGCSALLGSAFSKTPIVLSLMGSDAYGEYVGENKVQLSSRYMTLLTLLIQPFVNAIISKSENIAKYVYLKRMAFIIPNGIDTSKFKSSSINYREELKLSPERKQVLFLGSEDSIRKNKQLVQQALTYLNRNDVELVNPYPVSHEAIPKYLNSVHVLAVCSFMEGSPNVVKEAMACNCPIVATAVGDVEWVLGNTPGCYTATFQPQDFANKLNKALAFSEETGRTKGEARIRELGLDSVSVAKRVINIYSMVLK